MPDQWLEQSVSSIGHPRPEVDMRVRLLCIGWVAWLLVGPAWAAERALSVTIYNDDLALVQDRRDIEVKDGRQRIEFQDVSAQIRPETVSLSAADIASSSRISTSTC